MNSLKTGLLNLGLVLPPGYLWRCSHAVLEAEPCQITTQSSRETQGPDDHEDSLVDLTGEIIILETLSQEIWSQRNRKR